VRSLVLVAWVLGLAWGVMFVLLPETSRDELGVGALATSLLFTGVGLGLLSMSITLAARQPTRPGRIIALALVLGPGCGILAVGLSGMYVLTWVLAFVVGAGAGATTVLQRGLLQRRTPTELLGRVMSISAVGLMGSFPIAAGIAAILSATIGPSQGIAVIGAVTIVAAVALGVRAPLRNA
jgi:DHA3 family tetracycline resistance protein-like MFS transporter